jgi:uncharacterized protein (TIGR02466 family)
MKPEIKPIFPTPIYITKLDRMFSQEEISFVNKIEKETIKNEGNLLSIDNYILNNLEFKKIKEEITIQIDNYFNKIIDSKYESNLYITQSWLNYTKENEYHHVHKHYNSIVSGVLYISADKNNDYVVFVKDNNNEIKIEYKNINEYNYDTCSVIVDTGNLILFPSSLKHKVLSKKGNNNRISLSFNTFIKGKIGNKESLTELYL